MISTNFTLSTLTLVLIVFSVFTVALTENLQLADGLSALTTKLIYELEPGETKMLEWGVINSSNQTTIIEFYATGAGSELLVFEQFIEIPAHTMTNAELFVIVPKDHPNNIEYRPLFHALDRGPPLAEGESGMIINVEMQTIPSIRIGDNPIYTAPPPLTVEEKEEVVKNDPALQTPPPTEETLEEKLARIQAANQANAPAEVVVDDVWEEEAVPELVVDDSYIEEPTADPVGEWTNKDGGTEVKAECGFIDWLLSLFGLAKC